MKFKFYKICAAVLLVLACSAKTFAQSADKLQRDISALLLEKSMRSPAQKKMDSRLLQAVREQRGQKMAEGVDLEKAIVGADATGNLQVDITATVTDGLIAKLKALGATILGSSVEYGKIRATINLSAAEVIAGIDAVRFIEPAAEAMTVGSRSQTEVAETTVMPAKEFFSFLPTQKKSFEERADIVKAKLKNYLKQYDAGRNFAGPVNSEGDRAHRADDVRNTYGYEGQGVRIGVLSDSYNAKAVAAIDVANAELPGIGNPAGNTTPVTVLSDYVGGSDEGRAMLQIVHDIAPQAQLFYATAFIGDFQFAASIKELRNAPNNCDIIIDDIFYFNEPVFQDGIIAKAVNTVTADGALYFSSAGNSGSVARGSAGYYEGDFNDAGSPVFLFPGGSKAGTIHNFGTVGSPLNGDVITKAGNSYTLNWADPTDASVNDYDLFLINNAGGVRTSSTNIQSGFSNAYESISPPTLAAGDKLLVFKSAGAEVRAFSINTNRGTLSIVTNGQTSGHSCAVDAIGVAATPAAASSDGLFPGPFPSAFVSSNRVEKFSSDGRRRKFFQPDGTPITAGNFLFGTNGGIVLNKPDITAADGVRTTVAGSLGQFYGTSAAAPHAGAIAGLLKSAIPTLTAAQIKTALYSTALDIEAPGIDDVSGVGVIQAFQAMQFINPAGIATLSLGTVTFSETTGNSNGSIEPGESGSIIVQLTDPSLATATIVSATLTTATPDVTITQSVANYGTIAASGGTASNTATPYIFNTGSAVPCGTKISFTLTVTFNGGLTKVFAFIKVLGNQAPAIVTTLGNTPPANPAYVATSGQQTGRIARTSLGSICATPKSNPGLTAVTGQRQYDAYTFTNSGPADQCVTVTFTAVSASLYTATYNNTGFVPATPSANFLADPGMFNTNASYSFTAPAGQKFTVVVHDLNVLPTSATPYTLNVSLNTCQLLVLPVTWVAVSATQQNGQITVDWKVANEINVSRYEVEYSKDGDSFSPLFTEAAKADAASERKYNKLHLFPAKGINYYRIKQIDKDGKFSYSKTVSAKVDQAELISIAPNPAADFAMIQAGSNMTRIQLYTAGGQLISDIKPAATSYRLSLSNVPAGQYFIRIQTKDAVVNKKLSVGSYK